MARQLDETGGSMARKAPNKNRSAWILKHFSQVLLAALAAAGAGSTLQSAGQVRGLYTAQELSARAERIILGTVVGINPMQFKRSPESPPVTAFKVHLKVLPSGILKGPPTEIITYYETKAGVVTLGEEVLVFLNRPSSYGLVIPVGIDEGRFNIRIDQHGQKWAMSGASASISRLDQLLASLKKTGG